MCYVNVYLLTFLCLIAYHTFSNQDIQTLHLQYSIWCYISFKVHFSQSWSLGNKRMPKKWWALICNRDNVWMYSPYTLLPVPEAQIYFDWCYWPSVSENSFFKICWLFSNFNFSPGSGTNCSYLECNKVFHINVGYVLNISRVFF